MVYENIVLVSSIAAIGLLVVLEVGLRLLFGFGNPLIYLADEKIGYLLVPNQRTKRFGNWIAINEYSMRSPTIALERSASTLRVLLLGDSVANGAWWTDQNRTISALITRQLELLLPSSGENLSFGVAELGDDWICRGSTPVPTPHGLGATTGGLPLQNHSQKQQCLSFEHTEILNASANSWGPRNELAYLQRFGTFQAQAVVLLINTDDLFATAPTSVQVGRDRNYPNRKPLLALAEVYTRYVLPAPVVPEMAVVQAEPGDRVGFNLEAIGQIQTLARAANSKFLIAMTPLLRELGEPGSRDYERQARQRLVDFTQAQQICYIDFLSVFNDTETPESLYRDHIHLSPEGNRKVSEIVARSLVSLLQISATTTTD